MNIIKQIQKWLPIRLYALTLLLATPQILHAESASSQLWSGIISGVSSEVSSEVIGWGLSALGVDQDSGETTELQDINSDLIQIESELEGIEDDLNDILLELAEANCTNASNTTTLTTAVTVVSDIFSNDSNTGYQNFIESAVTDGATQAFSDEIFGVNSTPGTPTDPYNPFNFPSSWLYSVFATSPNLGDAITNINTEIIGSNGVLVECIPPYSTSYMENTDVASGLNTQAGPLGHPFDDLGYYSGIQTMVGYYTTLQIQGAAMMSEAWHLRACMAAVAAEYIDSCDFSSTSSTSPVYEICNTDSNAYNDSNGTDTGGFIKTYCDNATSSVGDIYNSIKAELISAGAPYSWPGTTANPRYIGIVNLESTSGDTTTGSAFLAPQWLLDFTNTATDSSGDLANDGFETECFDFSNENALTSEAQGCGFTAGPYNKNYVDSDGAEIDSLTYAGYTGWTYLNTDGDNQNNLWPQIFGTYNNSSTLSCSDTTNPACQQPTIDGKWSTYMHSIGFQNVGNKIILMPHKKVATQNCNGDNIDAVCNIFTGMRPLNGSLQPAPFCTGRVDSGTTRNMLGTDAAFPSEHLQNAIIETSQQGLDVVDYANGYYNIEIVCHTGTNTTYDPAPGWFPSKAGESEYFQYRWPFLKVAENVDCSARSSSQNASNIYFTMCGNDLLDYVDAILPAPPTTTTTASADTTLSSSEPNVNDGANERLQLSIGWRLGGSHGAPTGGIAVQFGTASTGDNGLKSATLRVTFVDANGHQHPRNLYHGIENRIAILALPSGFVEGNGDTGNFDLGMDQGATWNCAIDGDISNFIKDCVKDWPQGLSDRSGLNKLRSGKKMGAHYDRETGELSLDVTEDVRNGIKAWFIQAKGGRDFVLYSREGASALGESGLAPTLILENAEHGANTDD